MHNVILRDFLSVMNSWRFTLGKGKYQKEYSLKLLSDGYFYYVNPQVRKNITMEAVREEGIAEERYASR